MVFRLYRCIYSYPIFNNHIEDGRLKIFEYVSSREFSEQKKNDFTHNRDFVNDAFYLYQWLNHKVIPGIIKIRLSSIKVILSQINSLFSACHFRYRFSLD